MKRSILGLAAAAAASVLVLAGPASADHSGTFTGSILAGNPSTGVTGGVTENREPCTVGGDLAGVDGVWFDIDTFAGGTGTLTTDATLDGDVWFYTASCGFIDDATFAQTLLGESESGTVPATARYAIVDGFVGTGNFTLTLTGPPEATPTTETWS